MSEKTDYLSRVTILQGLSSDELDVLGHGTRLVNYAAGHLFYMPEDFGEVMFILKLGRVQLYRISPDGRKLIIAILNPGAIFGHMVLIGQGMHNTYAQALDDVTICVWSRELVEATLLSKPEVALKFLNAVAYRLNLAEERLAEIAFKRLPARLAALLLRLCDEKQSRELEGFTHQHLADMLGTYRETVTQILNEWRGENYLELSRKRIHVLNAEALVALAEIG
jgi:CRP/FNR family transcriptional regulator, cyclic AMP receptor protein